MIAGYLLLGMPMLCRHLSTKTLHMKLFFREKDPMSSIMDAKDLFKCTQSTVTQFCYECKYLLKFVYCN